MRRCLVIRKRLALQRRYKDRALRNAVHAKEIDAVSKQALGLLRKNSAAAAEASRSLTDYELDSVATVSLYSNAPLTSQCILEDHAVGHRYHPLGKVRAALRERV